MKELCPKSDGKNCRRKRTTGLWMVAREGFGEEMKDKVKILES